jgi:competence protein ComEA
MKFLKSHITFTKQQRYGIFLLICLIVIIQLIYVFLPFGGRKALANSEEINLALIELDSLKQKTTSSDSGFKIYPFNPNYINDFKGYQLGLSTEEIDKLLAYRKQNKWINSANDFKQVTQVSDSLLALISPYFKFPDWVTSTKSNKNNYNNISKVSVFDLNTATSQQLESINGIGPFYANKIIDLRAKLDGFAAYQELYTIYGLTPEVLENVKKSSVIKNPRLIVSIDLNKATKAELVKIPYIDYEIAFKIIEYRTLNEKITDISELLKINSFSNSKFEIIKLYLHIN